MSALRFDAGTMERLLDELARCSAPGPGVTRFVYDEHWCAAQERLVSWAQVLDLEATRDQAGNLLFHEPTLVPGQLDRPVLMVGSHLDTVRNGGRFDGAYGVIAGMMLAAEHRGRMGLPVVGFVTCEEEQSRFDSHMMGARSLLGIVPEDELDWVRDASGVTWRQALDRVRASGHAAAAERRDRELNPEIGRSWPAFTPLFRAACQLELHIEQGPALESAGLELGIVGHIAGYRRLVATVTGAARHAGTTPLEHRRDALAAAAEMILAVESMAREWGEPARATAGNVAVTPGLFNVVAGACDVWFEVRHVEPGKIDEMVRDATTRFEAIAERRGVGVRVLGKTQQKPTPLSPELVREAVALAEAKGLRYTRMSSGAAHDTMEFARAGVPALMLFVPSRGGISHSPDESTPVDQLWTGIAFASDLIARLAVRGRA